MTRFALMARFNAWANQRLLDAVASLSAADYRRDAGVFFGSVHHTLNHLLVVDRLWLARIAQRPPAIAALDQILYDDFAALCRARREQDLELIDLVDGLAGDAFARRVRYRRIIGEGLEEVEIGHMLLTLFNHQTHHRGQVHALLTQAGVIPPPLDVIFFLEERGETGLSGVAEAGAAPIAPPLAVEGSA